VHHEVEGSGGVVATTTVRMSYSEMLEKLKLNKGPNFKGDKMMKRLPIFK
jgi:hypothetical protein